MKLLFTLLITMLTTTTAYARDRISVVGSSTVFPYSQAVSEEFAMQTGSLSPVIESLGTGGGFQVFCGGIGTNFPDITGASRAIKQSEYDLCLGNGVTDITEALIGYDGLSIATSRNNEYEWDFTLAEIYLALAAQVPVNGVWVDNPFQSWSEINPNFPDVKINVLGPPPTSGTRDAFVELAMHKGCEQLDYVLENAFDHDWVVANCSRMRTDGLYIDSGENDNLIVQRLGADTEAMGIFGYSFLYENTDVLKGININGIEPSIDTIASFSYPISRPLYIYIKNAHISVIPNLEEFIGEFVSDSALAPGGYLSERGLVPLSADQLIELQTNVLGRIPFTMP